RAAGLALTSEEDAVRSLAQFLCDPPEAGPALLILDNFEHLAQGGALILRDLLERGPCLTCLVTSRHRLNLTGEQELALSPLPGTEAIELFVDRARAARP